MGGTALTVNAADFYGNIWLGSTEGAIDVVNPADYSIKKIRDIFNSGRTLKKIMGIFPAQDTVFIATEFGLSLLDPRSLQFYDTYSKFSSLPANTAVTSFFRSNLLFVGTPFGVAVQKPGSTNLNAPESWDLFTTVNGLVSNNISKISDINGEIIAATDKGFSKFNGGNWSSYLPYFSGLKIVDFLQQNEKLYIIVDRSTQSVQNFNIYFLNNFLVTDSIMNLPILRNIISSDLNTLYISSNSGILKVVPAGVSDALFPNGPQANLFSGIATSQTGNLWVGSGTDVSGAGYYRFDGSKWTNFNTSTNPELPSNSYYNVYSDNSGNVYLGNYGKGFIKISENNSIQVFNSTNTPLRGIASDQNFVVISSLKKDSKGNLWILNYDAGDRFTLNTLTTDSTWYQFTNPAAPTVTVYPYMVIDQFDTKWFASNSRNGVFYFNENNTLGSTNDDKTGFLGEPDGLNGQRVNALVIDKRGDLWVGTNLGVNILSNLSSVLSSGSSTKPRVSSVFSIRQQKINSISVDAINRKWIGTDQGLFLLSPDGTSLLAAFDSKNSPLLSDEVKIVYCDEPSGKVFIAQTGGLIEFQTLAPSPNADYSNLVTFPSPFRISSGNDLMTIDGLIKDSEIMIINISGKVIRKFVTPGGRIATWDGRDDSGEYTSSGVYILIAHDKDGNTIATSKFVVIRGN